MTQNLRRFNKTRAIINSAQLKSIKAQGNPVPTALKAQVESDRYSQSSFFSKFSQFAHSTVSSLSTSVHSALQFFSPAQNATIVPNSPPVIESRVINSTLFVVRQLCDPSLGPKNNCLPPPGAIGTEALTAGRVNPDGSISNCLPAVVLFVTASKQLVGPFLSTNLQPAALVARAFTGTAYTLNNIGNLTSFFIGECARKVIASPMLDSIAAGGPMQENMQSFKGDSNSLATFNIEGGSGLISFVSSKLVSTVNSTCFSHPTSPEGDSEIASWKIALIILSLGALLCGGPIYLCFHKPTRNRAVPQDLQLAPNYGSVVVEQRD